MPGRPERPLDPFAGPVPQFAHELRNRRQAAGVPPYRIMASQAHYSTTALSQAAAGKRLPTWDVTKAYLEACGADAPELRRWHTRWEAANRAVRVVDQPAGQEPDVSTGGEAFPMNAAQHRASTLPMLASVHGLEEYRVALEQIRSLRGLSLRRLAELSRQRFLDMQRGRDLPGRTAWLTRTGMSEMLNGKAPLRSEIVELYLAACGLPAVEVDLWGRRLRELTFQHKRAMAALQQLAMPDDDHGTDVLPLAQDEPAVVDTEPTVLSRVTSWPWRAGSHRRRGGVFHQLRALLPRRGRHSA